MGSLKQSGPVAADVHAKALAINLDPTIYGTIAEIGAGQGSGPLVPDGRWGVRDGRPGDLRVRQDL